LGRNCRFLQGPLTDRGEVDRLRKSIAAKTPIELELLNYRKNGTTFWNRLLVSPVFNDDGDLTYFFASQFDVTLERERLTRLERDRTDLESTVAGFGTKLIQHVLASEIGGRAEIDYQPNGVIFRVVAPLPETNDELA
jgi:two-component sensor histidine kinase